MMLSLFTVSDDGMMDDEWERMKEVVRICGDPVESPKYKSRVLCLDQPLWCTGVLTLGGGGVNLYLRKLITHLHANGWEILPS
jgi:hypothetical protein